VGSGLWLRIVGGQRGLFWPHLEFIVRIYEKILKFLSR
jgi:hypothetical protein